MTFHARLFIQGVGSYVPHEDDDKLLVLFPNNDHTDVQQLPRPRDQEICDHYAAAQMEARSLVPDGPDVWLSLDVEEHWIGFEAGGNPKPMSDVRGRLEPFLPQMGEVLGRAGHPQFAALRHDVLPAAGAVAKRLKGGLFLDTGEVKSFEPYQSNVEFVWSDGTHLPQPYRLTATNVVEVDLGEVSDLRLKLRRSSHTPTTLTQLHPVDGELRVWIRHFCDPARPVDRPGKGSAGEMDADFALSYALRHSLQGLLQATGNMVPIPRTYGVPAGKPRQCMGELEAATTFSSPF